LSFIDGTCRFVVLLVGLSICLHAVLLSLVGVLVYLGMANTVTLLDLPIPDRSIPGVILLQSLLGFSLLRVVALTARK
jgi:hypothetical protein